MKLLLKILKDRFDLKNLDIKDIEAVVMDSRKAHTGVLFFAINNGNLYIDEVLNKGAALVIADNYQGDNPKVIKVENSVETMQEIAHKYREALGLKVIGITGSNGKTTTKDMIHSVLSQKYRCKKTQGNYNNHIGLPYTILQLEEHDEVVVLEMGMSAFGEIDRLSQIAKLDYGVITNIGDSHLEFLKTRENVFKAKTEMIKYLKSENILVFGDDNYLKNLTAIKVGYGENNDFQIKDYIDTDTGISFSIDNEKYRIDINGKHNCINGAMAVVLGHKMGLTSQEIQKGLESLQLTPMRFEKLIIGDCIYINDAYNASPISMKYSLETFDKLYNTRYKIVVLGDMLELGEKEIEYHKEIIEIAEKLSFDEIFLFGERMKKAFELLKTDVKVRYFSSKDEIKKVIRENMKKKVILLKGSRGIKMEEIIER